MQTRGEGEVGEDLDVVVGQVDCVLVFCDSEVLDCRDFVALKKKGQSMNQLALSPNVISVLFEHVAKW